MGFCLVKVFKLWGKDKRGIAAKYMIAKVTMCSLQIIFVNGKFASAFKVDIGCLSCHLLFFVVQILQ